MLQKFIWWTGLSDFLVGAGTWAGAIGVAMAAEPVKGQFVPLITLGTFLMMAAALLMWSSHDMASRAPVCARQTTSADNFSTGEPEDRPVFGSLINS